MAGPFAGAAAGRSRRRRGEGRADRLANGSVFGQPAARTGNEHQQSRFCRSTATSARSLSISNPTEGKAVLIELVKTADVFLQNLSPRRRQAAGRRLRDAERDQPQARLRLDVGLRRGRARTPRIAQDRTCSLQSMSGAMLSAGRAGDPPQPAGQYLADAVTAYCAFEGVLAALLHRERTGEGQLVAGQHARCSGDASRCRSCRSSPSRPQAADTFCRAARALLYPRALRRLRHCRTAI